MKKEDIPKAFKSYTSYATFNIRVIDDNIWVNDLKIIPQGYPRISERNLEIYKKKITQKISFVDLGKEIGVTKQRAYQICKDTDDAIKIRYFLSLFRR